MQKNKNIQNYMMARQSFVLFFSVCIIISVKFGLKKYNWIHVAQPYIDDIYYNLCLFGSIIYSSHENHGFTEKRVNEWMNN